VTVLQDFIWLPPDFVANTLQFYNGGGGTQRPSLISYPRKLFTAPVHVLDTDALSYSLEKATDPAGELGTSAPLSIFKEPLAASPADMGWSPAPPAWDSLLAEGSDAAVIATASPSFYWECFACTAPWAAVLALNGVDERLDETGDDCHERNLSERARLLGYDVRLLQGTRVSDIDHRSFVGSKSAVSMSTAADVENDPTGHDPLWERSESNTNVQHWGRLLSEIVDLVAPIRSGAPGTAANPFELWRGDSSIVSGARRDRAGLQPLTSRVAGSSGSVEADGGSDDRALIALIMPITSIVKDCLTCKSYANTDVDQLLVFTVLMDSFLRSVNWETEGRAFNFAFYCSYDPGDAVYDNPVLRAAVEAKAAAMLGKYGAKLVLERVVRDEKQLEWGNIMPLWNAVAARASRDGADYFYLGKGAPCPLRAPPGLCACRSSRSATNLSAASSMTARSERRSRADDRWVGNGADRNAPLESALTKLWRCRGSWV
jgi:hypothetical protein